MRYLMMKRVMLAILLPFLVVCLFGAKALSEYWVVWFFVCAMLMITAWGVWLKNKNRGSSFSYLNDNEDGVFIYKFHNQEIRLDKAKKQLYLKDGLNEKPTLSPMLKAGNITLAQVVRSSLQVLTLQLTWLTIRFLVIILMTQASLSRLKTSETLSGIFDSSLKKDLIKIRRD